MAKYRVMADSLNVRKDAGITAAVVGNLHKGDIVEESGKSPDGYWFKVKKGSLEGWASSKYLVSDTGGTEEFPWMPFAVGEIGTKETPGAADNPRVVQYLKSTTLKPAERSNDETPWCSAFVNWCVEQSGVAGTDSAWAKSWLNWGQKITTPKRGCVVVFKRGEKSGHVAFYVGETATHIKVLGGNQSNAVNESNYEKSRLLGYRIP